MIRRILKTIGWIAGGVGAIGVVLYLIAIAINWRDRSPSATAVQFETLYRDRPAVADEDNAFVYVMGFDVSPGESPEQMGLKRVAWMEQSIHGTPLDATKDPLGRRANYRAARSPRIREFLYACNTDSVNCAAAFDGGQEIVDEWMASEGWLLERYRVLIAHTGWRESVPFDPAAPFPAYASVMDGQKLLLLQARALAEKGDYDGTRQLLQNDNLFWRRVLESSDTLISKMIATVAIRRNFQWGNLIIRLVRPENATKIVPVAWRAAISDSERSMLRCMVGEWKFASAMLVNAAASNYVDEEGSLGRKVFSLMFKPMYQPQDSMNAYAEYYSRVAQTWNVPFREYEAAMIDTEELAHRMTEEAFPPKSVYNVVGKFFMPMGAANFGVYARRVADLEGVRRAVMAAVTLRGANVAASGVGAVLATTALRNPYTDKPFAWDDEEGAIVFRGLEAGEPSKHRIYY